jgi:hypothetical protein
MVIEFGLQNQSLTWTGFPGLPSVSPEQNILIGDR